MRRLKNNKDGINQSFGEFLSNLEMNEEQYISAIRSSLTQVKIFLKREPSDIRVNAHSKSLLSAWNANQDLQFVLDPYACAMYIVDYISKSQKGMSALLDKACKEAKQGNMDIKKSVRHIGNKFLNSVEICAQEAVYLVLQLPMSKCSRDVLFVNTSPQESRTFLLKSKSELEELDDDSTDVEANNLIKRYAMRPKQLDDWCLADYASKLNINYKTAKTKLVNKSDHVDSCNEEPIIVDDEQQTCKSRGNIVLQLKNGTTFTKRLKQKVIRYVKYDKKSDPENFYREQLMLFLPWRNELIDLLNGHETYEEHYNIIQDNIAAKASEYSHFTEILDRVSENSRNLGVEDDDAFDLVAPSAQEADAQDSQELNNDSRKFIYFNPDQHIEAKSYDLGIDIGLAPVEISVDLLPTRLPQGEYLSLLRSLNIKQRELFSHVLHWIKTKNQPLNIFLTGGAGVGKSVVIRALYQALHRYCCSSEGQDPNDIRILLCAPTGKAAYNINGTTLHSAFHLPVSQGFSHYKALDSEKLNTLQAKYRHLSILMIDEVSMVGNDMFNFINLRLHQIKGSNQLFGGIHVIVIGDLFQLKPVMSGGWIFDDLMKDYGPLATNLWKDLFTMYELDEVMRQKDDQEFALLLNRIREGKHTPADIESLKQRVIDPKAPDYPHFVPHLFCDNAHVNHFNQTLFNRSDVQKLVVPSLDAVTGDFSPGVKERILHVAAKLDPSKTAGLSSCLQLGVGLHYEVTANINVEDGLTNGAAGTVKLIDHRLHNTNRPSIIWVHFDDEKVGIQQRRQYNSFYHDVIHKTWTPIFDIKRSFRVTTYNKNASVIRIQFPLRAAAAKTIHRAQGETLDQVVVHLGNRKLEHIHYVALSRVRNFKALHILELNEDKIATSFKVQDELYRLRTEAKLELTYTPVYTVSADKLKIIFHNARSVHAHMIDITSDPNFTSADIIGLAESRLNPNDDKEDYSFPQFESFRNDEILDEHSEYRPYHGLLTLVRDSCKVLQVIHFNSLSVEFSLFIVQNNSYDFLQVVFMYRSNAFSLEMFKGQLEKYLQNHVDNTAPLLIMGDFNYDISDDKHKNFLSYMCSTFNCRQLIHEPTTDYGSSLDLLFTNIDSEIFIDTLECPWSDHKGIFCALYDDTCISDTETQLTRPPTNLFDDDD